MAYFFESGAKIDWSTLRPGELSVLAGRPRPRFDTRRMPIAIGTVLAARYHLVRAARETGLGVLYEAIEIASGRRVMVHCVDVQSNPSTDMFQRHARALVETHAAHLCTTLFVGTDDGGRPFLVSPKLEGETLADRVRDEHGIAAPALVAIMTQLLDALEAAHAASLVHGNVKPENVLLVTRRREAPRIQLLGLGAAAIARGPDGSLSTGTPPYLAPEHLAGAPADRRVDVWGAGLVLHEMLLGTRAFDGQTIEEVALAIVRGTARRASVSKRRPGAAWAEPILARALAPSPRDRYPSAAAMRDAMTSAWEAHLRRMRRVSVPCFSEVCDDAEGTTDLHVFVEFVEASPPSSG
jgi:serine/threonine protein kinase